jgi:hypothetical protein
MPLKTPVSGSRNPMNFAHDNPVGKAGSVTLELAPLDVPLRVECAPEALGPIAAACHGWAGSTNPLCIPLQLRIGPSLALAGTGQTEIRADAFCLTVRGPGVKAHAEVGRGFADCVVSFEYLNDPVALRQEVLDPLVLMLLTRRDRTPLHASAFIADGLAILLAGRSGAGKSCLARAADAAGFQVLSDDTVYVQLAPRLTIWGWPTAAHLLPEDTPDVAGPTRLRGGRLKHVVPLRSASQAAIACDHAVLCLLSPPQAGGPALSPATAAEVEARLWPLDEGFDLLPGPIARAVARLSARGAWDLRLSANPADAVRLLVASLPRLRDAASFALQ